VNVVVTLKNLHNGGLGLGRNIWLLVLNATTTTSRGNLD